MNDGQPGSSVHRISQATIVLWVAFPSPGDLPDPGMKSVSHALTGNFFFFLPLNHQRSPYMCVCVCVCVCMYLKTEGMEEIRSVWHLEKNKK